MNVDQWLFQNRMIASVKKTKSLLIRSRPAIKKAKQLIQENIIDFVKGLILFNGVKITVYSLSITMRFIQVSLKTF